MRVQHSGARDDITARRREDTKTPSTRRSGRARSKVLTESLRRSQAGGAFLVWVHHSGRVDNITNSKT